VEDDDDMLRRSVKRVRSGRYQLRLSAEERDILRTLPDQLKALVEADDPSIRRLFPPAYLEDPDAEAEYRRLMREDLIERHHAALDIMTATIDATDLDEEQLTTSGWCSAPSSTSARKSCASTRPPTRCTTTSATWRKRS